MINKSISVMIFMYALTTSLLAMQYIVADAYDITLTNYKGESLAPPLLNLAKVSNFDTASANIIGTNFNGTVDGRPFDKVVDFNQSMAYSVFQYISILSGTYVFYIMFFLGIPMIVVSGFMLLYSLLLIRTIVGVLRGF